MAAVVITQLRIVARQDCIDLGIGGKTKLAQGFADHYSMGAE